MGIDSRKVILGSGVAAAALLAASMATAQQRTFNIPSEEAAKAIPEFGRQADIQIVAPVSQLHGVNTPAVRGDLDVRMALATLLDHTGLEIASDTGTVITMRARPQSNAARESPRLAETSAEAGHQAAQTATAEPTDRGVVEEVVVTSRRREEVLQKVPLSVTAFTGARLKQQSVKTVSDLQGQVPGLFIQQAIDDPQSIAVTLRGRKQDDITLAVDPAVSLTVDGLYIPRTLGMAGSLLDVSRVEVLRGPQGTLFGRNSTGGAIGLYTNDPTDRLTGSIDVTGGNYNAWDIVGIANVPIIAETLGARFVAERGAHGGYAHNSTGTPLADESSEYYRAKILWRGPNELKAVLSAHYERNRAGPPRAYLTGLTPENFQNNGLPQGGLLALETQAETGLSLPRAVSLLDSWIAGKDSYLINNTGGPPAFSHVERWDVGLSLSGNLSRYIQFRSITGFQHLIRDELLGTQDSVTSFISTFNTRDNYVSQEIQLLGSRPGFNWVAGIYGGDEVGEDDNANIVLPAILGPAPTINNNGIRNSSLDGFAQASWEVIPT